MKDPDEDLWILVDWEHRVWGSRGIAYGGGASSRIDVQDSQLSGGEGEKVLYGGGSGKKERQSPRGSWRSERLGARGEKGEKEWHTFTTVFILGEGHLE